MAIKLDFLNCLNIKYFLDILNRYQSDYSVRQKHELPLKAKSQTSVLMLGPSLEEKGGMGTVQKQIINQISGTAKVQHISTWDGKNSSLSLFFRAMILFLHKLLQNEVDLVHIHLAEGGSVVRKSILAIIAFLFNKPVIMHTHGCEFHLFYKQLPQIFQYAVNLVLQKCTIVIVLSESWKKFYINQCKLNPKKTKVLYNPVTIPSEIPRRRNAKTITLAFLGKINQRKGIFDLLEALSQLPAEVKQRIRLLIAGSGDIEQGINLSKELDLETVVEFLGWVNTEQRDLLLARANIFVLPSYNEGLPMALLEAMIWGLPVITTPVGGIAEIVTHQETGLLVEPGNLKQLTYSIKSLVTSESLRLNLGDKARNCAASLDINQYGDNLLQIYSSILKNTKTLL